MLVPYRSIRRGMSPPAMSHQGIDCVLGHSRSARLLHRKLVSDSWSRTDTDVRSCMQVKPMRESQSGTSDLTPAEIVASVISAGGNLMVPDPQPSTRAAYRRIIHEILNGDFVPPGYRLRYKGRDHGDLTLAIVRVESEPRPDPPSPPIPIPETLRGCHPRATRETVGKGKSGWVDTYHQKGVAHLRVHASSAQRSLLVLQAMINEAGRRGLSVATGLTCEGLVLVDGSCIYELAFKEETHRLPHEPTASEVQQINRATGGTYRSGTSSPRVDWCSCRATAATPQQSWQPTESAGPSRTS